MTDKAFITKRGSVRNEDTEALEKNTAQKFGFKVESNFPHGTLISADNLEQLSKLEAEGYRVKILPDTNILDIGSYRIDVEKEPPELPSELEIPESLKDSWSHYIVHCTSPPTASMVKQIEEEGIDVVEVMSQKAIFVVCKPDNLKKLANLPFVAKALIFKPAYRIDEKLFDFKGNIQDVRMDIYPPEDIESVKEAIKQVDGKIISDIKPTKEYQGEYARLTIEVNSDHIATLARLPSVRRLEYREPKPTLDGEREAQIIAHNLNNLKPIPGYKLWLSEVNLSGEGVTIAICDSGVDVNSKNNTEGHSDIHGRQAAFIDYTNGTDKTDTNGHGTHVAGICVGNAGSDIKEGPPPEDFLWGQGIAPNSKYVNINFLSGKVSRAPDDYGDLIEDVTNSGAHIMNNSWGSKIPDASYNDDVKTIDGLCRNLDGSASSESLIIVFSSGNRGPDYYTLTSPHAAKNPIIVGNSLTFRDPRFSNHRGIAESSSRGPTNDERIRPDIVAPGTYVSSAWPKTGNPTYWDGFVDGTNKRYMFGTGTSMSAPQISGSCALLIEWWRKRTNGKNPTIALLKALLINSAEDLEGGPSGRKDVSDNPIPLKHIPNNDQGWGLVNLNKLLKKIPGNNNETMIFSDQRNPFTSEGQEHSIKVTPKDDTQELRITLTWTDPPGEIGARHALVNDLDLEVTEEITGNIYKGNVFDEGYSIIGGNFDNINNVECVYIKKPKGTYEIRIIAFKVSSNARPPFNKVPWQDYALVINNAKIEDNSSEGVIVD